MRIFRYVLPPLVAIAAVACATNNTALTQAHGRYNAALIQPGVMDLAAEEVRQAGSLLAQAYDADGAGDDEAVEQLAYLAKRQADIALETAKRKTAEADIAYAAAKYNQMRQLEQSTEAYAAEQRLKQLHAQKTDRGLMITLDADSLNAIDLDKLAKFLDEYPQYNISIESHTDSIGSRNVNQGISDRRSCAVRLALIGKGIDGDRIRTRGFADAFPVAGNNSAIGRRLNRRVEIIFSDEYGNLFPHSS